MTNDVGCGSLVYEARVVGTYDPFGMGHASITDNVLLFDNPSLYPEGIMTVTVDILLTTTLVYTIQVPITIIDCSNTFTWNSNPVTDPSGLSPDAAGSPPFFNLIISNTGLTYYTLNWDLNYVGDECGESSTSMSVTGTTD